MVILRLKLCGALLNTNALSFTVGVELGVYEWRHCAEDPAEEEEVADLADHLPNKEGVIRPAAKLGRYDPIAFQIRRVAELGRCAPRHR